MKYCLLGDDLIINGKDHSLEYLKLCDELGMLISYEKTFISDHFLEFSKRIILNKTEVTAFPVGTLLQAKDNIHMLSEAQKQASQREWTDSISKEKFCNELLFILGIKQQRARSYLVRKLTSYHLALVPFSPE